MEMTRRKFLALSSIAAAATVMSPGAGAGKASAATEADAFFKLDGVAQARLVEKGEATAIELLEAAIARIERLNPKLNAVVTKTYEAARERAAAGAFAGPFRGVPFLVKDLNDVAGVRTTAGCRALLGNIAERNDPYIGACIDAGFNICGKSNTPEFGLQATTESLALGPCYNPWDTIRSSGGSSGGAGAAVAAGIIPIAHGNDGGGSIRIPASCCGVFGLKPSRGRVIGETPAFSLAVEGALSRSVRDTAHLLAHTENQPPSRGLKSVGLVEGPTKRRFKIGMYLEGADGQKPAPDVVQAIQSTAALCQELGHEVVDAKVKFDGEKMVDDFLTLWASEAGVAAEALEAELNRKVDLQLLEPLTLAFAEQYRSGGKERMGGAAANLIAMAEDVLKQMEGYDMLLCPVLSTAAPLIGEQGPTVPYDLLIERMTAYVAYTPLHNVTGMPAMSVPLYWNEAGLPIGSQFAAKVGDEQTLLELAYQLEEARPWADKWAPVSASQV